jgi:hypothetical protein
MQFKRVNVQKWYQNQKNGSRYKSYKILPITHLEKKKYKQGIV